MKEEKVSKKSIGLVHKIYLIQLKNKRDYTANTKTKSEVRGGGRKPWRQKGTGNARSGSTRSPLWVGGGVTFGPKPRIVKKKANKRERQLAIFSAFYLKKSVFHILEKEFFEKLATTKSQILQKFLLSQKVALKKNTLLVAPRKSEHLWLSLRNIKNLSLTTWESLSVESILHASQILFSSYYLPFLTLNYEKFPL
jgi:large subunit ribosomal protein L4